MKFNLLYNLLGALIYLGGIIGAFTFIILGVWWLPQIIEFMELTGNSHLLIMKICLPIGVLFWGIIFFIISMKLGDKIKDTGI